MKLEGNYSLPGIKIGGPEVKEYEELIKYIKSSNEPKTCLERLCRTFETIGRSRPISGEEITWAKEMVLFYKNLGGIFQEIYQEFPNEDTISPEFKEILDKYKIFNPKELEESLDKLGNLIEMNKYLEGYNSQIDDLKNTLF
ncbi:MAG TPA: hypothetical protein VJ438_03105 [Candidatus Nanoarchaeia archaeon]|nr:hypothetical protein [Candidatus Nanoarchaeia archaeon]